VNYPFTKSVATLLVITLAVIVLAFIALKDELELLRNSTQETAQITHCVKKTFDLGKAGEGRVNQQFATEAVLASGHRVVGAFVNPTQGLCEKRLYRDVTILVHQQDKNRSRMNSFFDFWLTPFLFGLAVLILVLQTVREISSSERIPYAVHGVMAMAFVVILFNYAKNYETARNFELLQLEKQRVIDSPQTDPIRE